MIDLLSIPVFNRVTDYSGVWAIEPRAGASLWNAANRMGESGLRSHISESNIPERKSAIDLQPDGRGKSLAVIRLEGTMMKASSSMGGTGTVQLRKDIRSAASNPDVSAILLAIDSPGGTVAGTDDLARDVQSAKKQKPIYAFVSDLCASAAYWVASQCDAIFVNSETAVIGSIGTLLVVYDLSKLAGEQGVETLVFATGPLKGAGTQGAPVTEEQRAYFQGIVDDAQKSFDAGVQKGRGLTDKQLATVRTGGVFGATEALDRKLIDGIQSYEATITALVKESYQRQRGQTKAEQSEPRGISMATETQSAATEQVHHTEPASMQAFLADSRKQAAAELRRQAEIMKVCNEHKQPGIAAEAIEQGWSVEKAEVAAMKASLPKPGAAANPHTTTFGNGGQVNINTGAGNTDRVDAQVVEAALCMSLGINEKITSSTIAADRRERVMNEASSEKWRGITLHHLMDLTIQAAGMSYHGMRKSNGFIRAALQADRALNQGYSNLQPMADSGFSTISMSGLLGAVANKSMTARYMAVKTVWQEFCGIRNHANFQVSTRYRLDDKGGFKKVAPNGELKHSSLGETSFTNRLDTYGTMMTLNRQQQYNDDLGAFTAIPDLMGFNSATRLEEAVHVLLLSNPSSFYSTTNKNYLNTTASALSISAVTTAEKTFLDQVNSNGKPIGADPVIMLVPNALSSLANSIFASEKVNETTTTGKKSTDDNPHRGKYRPVTSRYLGNTNITDQDGAAITGQSSTGWYLFCDPTVMASIGVAFLNGQQMPTIESGETDFNTLGMSWRAYHDWGVGMEDTAASQWNEGIN